MAERAAGFAERSKIPVADILGNGGIDVRKRGTQNGSYRLKAGDWYVRFNEPRRDANANIFWQRTEKKVREATRKEADAWEKRGTIPRDVERDGYERFVLPANKLTNSPISMASLNEFVTMRFKPDHYPTLKKSGRQHYDTQLKHILPSLGDLQLADVTPQAVQILLSGKAEKLAPWSVKHIRDAISAIFAHARTLKFYSGDVPTVGVKIPTIVEAPRRVLTPDQVAAIALGVKPQYQSLIWTLAYTGLRIGEACGLKWMYVNLTDVPVQAGDIWIMPQSLFVRWQYSRNEWSEPKANSQRMIPLHRKLLAILQEYRNWSKWTGPEDCVFPSRLGGPIDAHNLATRELKPVVKKLGLPWASFHTFRHTASTAYDAVLSERQKQELLGHRMPSTTRRYTHPEAEQIRKAMEQIQ